MPARPQRYAPTVSKLPRSVARRIGPYYVYALVDPRDDAIFYVGKGTGRRLLSHGRAADLSDPAGRSSAKLDRIRAIRAAGLEPRIDVIRHGLDERSALTIEAALIDGAGPMAIFSRITLPELMPTLTFSFVLGTAATLQSFTGAYVATAGGPLGATMFIVLYLYEKAFHELQFGYAAALSMIVFAVSLGISVLLARLTEERT